VTEDYFFSITAMKRGLTIDWIEGEMREESPFTFWDIVKQRQRWFQGIFLTLTTFEFNPLSTVFIFRYIRLFLLTFSPFYLFLDICFVLFPLSFTKWDMILGVLNEAAQQYVFIVGTLNNFDFNERNLLDAAFLLVPTVIWTRYLKVVETLSVILGLFIDKDQFYVVKK
jgi:cellulose synthase/poly-beta-1,6-N-acetylglucosamine synthase-like glycosyltransferase